MDAADTEFISRRSLQCAYTYPAQPIFKSLLEAFLISTGVVALAEIGDKTQLLAFILAARFKKPLPIIAGILLATVVNHGLAGAIGAWMTTAITPEILRWLLGASQPWPRKTGNAAP